MLKVSNEMLKRCHVWHVLICVVCKSYSARICRRFEADILRKVIMLK